MTRKLMLILIAAFALPVVGRLIWFFPGIRLPRSISTPDYVSFRLPQAPVSTAAVAQPRRETGSVLIDVAHANVFGLSEVRSLTDALRQRGGGFVLDYKSSTLADQLKSASSFVVISPSQAFTSEEVALVQAFVNRGGRLAVFTDATRGVLAYDFYGNPVGSVPDVNGVNPLLQPFGITVNADYLYDLVKNEGNFRNVYLAPSAQSDLTAGVGKVAFYGAHSISTDSGSALMSGTQTTLSSSNDAASPGTTQKGWAGAVLSEDGNVLALGDFTFLSSPYDAVADNHVLIGNIAEFLLSGSRQPALADFPFIFQGKTVSILATSDLQMTAEMTGKLSKLQAALQGRGVQLNVVPEAPSHGDLIVLGLDSGGDDIARYTKPFGLTSDKFGEYVKLAPFGKVGQSGNGILLYRSGAGGNTLVALAADADDMNSLLDVLSSSDLSECVIQGNLAVCSVGIGGSFLENTPTPAPVAIPTAGG